MTFGQKLVLQQIQLVAHARGWNIPKTIKKVNEVLDCLQKIYDQGEAAKKSQATSNTGRAISSPEEAKLIAQAEQMLKDLQAHQKPADPSGPPPHTPPL